MVDSVLAKLWRVRAKEYNTNYMTCCLLPDYINENKEVMSNYHESDIYVFLS